MAKFPIVNMNTVGRLPERSVANRKVSKSLAARLVFNTGNSGSQ